MKDFEDQCSDEKCPCNQPRSYWLQVDPITGNPTAQGACWAYFDGDKPTTGTWIKVVEQKGKI
jgi:hypothetical protein